MNETAYTGFATAYDRFMDNIPYDKWSEYIVELLKEQGIKDGLVCELGCGTGNITVRLKDKGYDMIGIDSSYEMLEVAMYGREEGAEGILYLNQDIREMELYGTVNAFVSVCDTMNYLTTEEELLTVFKLANNYLEAGGIFVFDMKTRYEYSIKMGNRTITDNREDMSLIWENHFDEETGLNTYDITVYEEVEEGLFERSDETHVQRAYDVDKVKNLIEKAGMEFVACYDAFTHDAPKDDTERIYFIAKEKRQKGKLYV